MESRSELWCVPHLIRSPKSSLCIWVITTVILSGRWVSAKTSITYSYDHLWSTADHRTSLSFRVKACHDAHVALASTLADTRQHAYEIVLGASGNQYTIIRNMTLDFPVMTVHTPGILDCTEMRKFWISWEGGLVRVGYGLRAGLQTIMEWQDTDPYAIHAYGISTGFGASGVWQLIDYTGKDSGVSSGLHLPIDKYDTLNLCVDR